RCIGGAVQPKCWCCTVRPVGSSTVCSWRFAAAALPSRWQLTAAVLLSQQRTICVGASIESAVAMESRNVCERSASGGFTAHVWSITPFAIAQLMLLTAADALMDTVAAPKGEDAVTVVVPPLSGCTQKVAVVVLATSVTEEIAAVQAASP